MSSGKLNITHGVLMNLPSKWDASRAFDERVTKLGLSDVRISTETEFLNYWQKLLGLYFSPGKFDLSATRALTTISFWKNSQKMIDGMPTFRESAARLLGNGEPMIPILCIEGATDLRVCDDNLKIIQNTFPDWNYTLLDNCGHFPMLEKTRKTLKLMRDFLMSQKTG